MKRKNKNPLTTMQVRIYPDGVQCNELAQIFGCCRVTYNTLLELQNNLYKDAIASTPEGEKVKSPYMNVSEMNKYFHANMLKDEDRPWLCDHNSNVLKNEINNLDSAFKRHFKGKGGKPNFKDKYDDQSAKFNRGTGISKNNLKNGMISLTKELKDIKFKTSRKYRDYIINNSEHLMSVTVSKNKAGEYHASLLFDSPQTLSNENIKEPTNQSCGVDLGVKTLAVTSYGEEYDNKRFLDEAEKRLKKYDRKISRTKPHSNRRKKLLKKRNKLHAKVTDKRIDYIHNVTTDIVSKNQVIGIEDLNVKGMMRNHNIAKALQDASLGEFRRQLTYKCEKYGRTLVVINRYYPSSKKCSCCGRVKKKLLLSERTYVCEHCGLVMDRDLNAAKNIEKEALRMLSEQQKAVKDDEDKVGWWPAEVKPVLCSSVNGDTTDSSLEVMPGSVTEMIHYL